MRYVLLLLAICISGNALATSVLPKPLEELVSEADHVVVATITHVDLVDRAGKRIANRTARTGPGLHNTMRLHLKLEAALSGSAATPSAVIVPLWSAWHYELGTMQDQLTGSRGIFLLRSDFTPVYPAGFQRAMDERGEIEQLLRLKTP